MRRHNNHLNTEFFFRDLNDSSNQSVEIRLHPRLPRAGRQLHHGGALGFEGAEDGAGARAESPGVVGHTYPKDAKFILSSSFESYY